jgi:hypothetical protein
MSGELIDWKRSGRNLPFPFQDINLDFSWRDSEPPQKPQSGQLVLQLRFEENTYKI